MVFKVFLFKYLPESIGGFPGGSDSKRICLQCRRPGFDPWVRKISWRREWQPTPVFLPGEFQDRGAQRSIALGSQRVGHDWVTNTFAFRVYRSAHCVSGSFLATACLHGQQIHSMPESSTGIRFKLNFAPVVLPSHHHVLKICYFKCRHNQNTINALENWHYYSTTPESKRERVYILWSARVP